MSKSRDHRGERGLKADTQPIVDTQVVKEELPTVTDEEVTPNHCVDGVLTTHCVYPEGGGTQARYANLQPGVYGEENGTKQSIKEDGASLEESNAVENDILAYINSQVPGVPKKTSR